MSTSACVGRHYVCRYVLMRIYLYECNVANMAVFIVFFYRIVVSVVSGVRGNKQERIVGFCFIYY